MTFQSRRRQLLATSVLVPWLPATHASGRPPGPAAVVHGKALVLQQCGVPASASFATVLVAAGAACRSFDDPGRLLFGDLAWNWRQSEGVLCGLTEVDAYFCIERVGLDQGWRTVYRDIVPQAHAAWVAASADAVGALAVQPQRWYAASPGWSGGQRLQWMAWSMVASARVRPRPAGGAPAPA